MSSNASIEHARACSSVKQLARTMSDSPAVAAPLDPRELPILDALLRVRDELSLLKSDKSTYIRSQDVVHLYDQVIEQVHALNDLRQSGHKPQELNRGA